MTSPFLLYVILPGIALLLHQLTTLRNSAFQKENFYTTCCEWFDNPLFLLNLDPQFCCFPLFILSYVHLICVFVLGNCSEAKHILWNLFGFSIDSFLFPLIMRHSDIVGNILRSSQQKTIINAMAVNDDGVMATGGKDLSQLGILIP